MTFSLKNKNKTASPIWFGGNIKISLYIYNKGIQVKMLERREHFSSKS